MKVISFINFKGGCGKTTIACLMAQYLANHRNAQVRIRDLDEGGDMESFFDQVQHQNIKEFDETEGQGSYDFLIVDTPGGIVEEEMRAISELSDVIIIPFAITPTDIGRTRQTIDALGSNNKVRLLFNQVQKQTTAFKERKSVLNALGMKALKNHLSRRVGYSYALLGDPLSKECKTELGNVVKEIIR